MLWIIAAREKCFPVKPILLFIFCQVQADLYSQEVIEGKWSLACGASTYSRFREDPGLSLRWVSPRFRLYNENPYWTEEEEKHPEKVKKARLMAAIFYAPPLKAACADFNLLYRLFKYKKLSLDVYGGFKIFFVAPAEIYERPNVVTDPNRGAWYVNEGLILQLDLNVIKPFFDIGYDGIMTLGAEINFHPVYRKTRGRYNLHARKS